MKTPRLIITFFTAATVVVLLSSGGDKGGHDTIQNAAGTGASTGAPGEVHTCSQAGCHGAGNGNGSTGGLADNTGPGSMSITSIPAMNNNQYIPGTTYSMIITVSESGKAIFGFDAEILDNSGSTNLMVNNTAGTLVITNPTKTRIQQAFGTGRATVTHTTNGGLSANTATFVFNWKAPASGTVNIWASGISGNNDNLANAIDNVYLAYKQVTPGSLNITENFNEVKFLNVYPNPANEKINLSFPVNTKEQITIQLLSLDGKVVKLLDSVNAEEGLFDQTYSTAGIASGVYFIKVSSDNLNLTKKLVIN